MYEAEARYFLFLVDGEAALEKEWKGTFTSYEQLLRDQDLVDPARYTAFREALSLIPRDKAEAIGVDGVIKSARVTEPAQRAKCVTALEEWRRVHEHPPSSQTVAHTIQAIAPVQRTPRVLANVMEREKLEQENRALRARVRELEKRVVELEKQAKKTTKKAG
jgi:hypothetical protein